MKKSVVYALVFVIAVSNGHGFIMKKTNSSGSAAPPVRSPTYLLESTKSLNPTNTKSNLEMLLLSMAPGYSPPEPQQQKEEQPMKYSMGEAERQRGVIPVTHEEVDPLPLNETKPEAQQPTFIVKPTVFKLPSLVPSALNYGGFPANVHVATSSVNVAPAVPSVSAPVSSLEEGLYSIKEDQSRPMTNFQNIKDAYFDLLQQFKEFRKVVSKRITALEQQVEEQPVVDVNKSQMGPMSSRISEVYLKVLDVDFRHNLTRLMALCADKILGEELPDAVLIWHKIELSLPERIEYDAAKLLKEIVALTYTRNKYNNSPVYEFLRQLEEDVNKVYSYEFLLQRMDQRKDFEGPSVFYIAQYLKEHNAIRSTHFSKIPKSVQNAVSGRNVNIMFRSKRNSTAKYFVHVKDDGNRRERNSFYVKASHSYAEPKAAIWRTIYYPATGTFRLRNVMFNDYILANEEGFLETTSMANANQRGTEFQLSLEKGGVVFRSVKWNHKPIVSHFGGGKYPYFFSVTQQDSLDAPAVFSIEHGTLSYEE